MILPLLLSLGTSYAPSLDLCHQPTILRQEGVLTMGEDRYTPKPPLRLMGHDWSLGDYAHERAGIPLPDIKLHVRLIEGEDILIHFPDGTAVTALLCP